MYVLIDEVTSSFVRPTGNLIPEIAALMSDLVATSLIAVLMAVFTPASVANPVVPVVIAAATSVRDNPGFVVM
jgi:hypothetical protein